MVKDIICGMDVNPKTAAYKSVYEGKEYYFCNRSCKLTFEKNPRLYVEIAGKDQTPPQGTGKP